MIHSKQHGFTLIELIISAALISVISTLILALFNGGWESYRTIDVQLDLDSRFDQTVAALRQDVPRAVSLTASELPTALILNCVSSRIVYSFERDGVRRSEIRDGATVSQLVTGPWSAATCDISADGLLISGTLTGRSLKLPITINRAAFIARRMGASL